MSGHSKWATIHRQKETKDARRGAMFAKLARAITVAVRQGGGVADPNGNYKLRLAVEKARQFNLPKENIQRAIERAVGAGAAGLEEALFEGFLPGGVAVVVHALTGNRQRTAQVLRQILEKGGGKLAGQGAVAYAFSADMKPNFLVEVTDAQMRQKVEAILEKLDHLEDVQKVWANYA